MNKRVLMKEFIETIDRKKLMTQFIKDMFNYQELYDYNYLFRIKEEGNMIIIDIYDNVSNNRFNRYIYRFSPGKCMIKIEERDNVFVNYINIMNIDKDNYENNIIKLGYLFKLRKNKMIDYAHKFLSDEVVDILNEILKKQAICCK